MLEDLHRITKQDLADFYHLVPDHARRWCAAIGDEAGLALMNNLAGAVVAIPKRHDGKGARRWVMLGELVGDEAMQRLANAYGGEDLVIPVLRSVQIAKRSRMIRARFAEMRAISTSRADAVLALCIALNRAGQPMTTRQIFQIVPAD